MLVTKGGERISQSANEDRKFILYCMMVPFIITLIVGGVFVITPNGLPLGLLLIAGGIAGVWVIKRFIKRDTVSD